MDIVTYELAEGAVHVEVLAAVDDDFYDVGRGRVSVVYPVLRVTTWTDSVQTPGYVKLRGKLYSADSVEVLTPDGWRPDHNKYLCRYRRTEAGNSLDWRSPTGRKLNSMLDEVRERFVAEHPGWARVSLARRIERKVEAARREQAGAEAAARKAAEQVHALTAELHALTTGAHR